MISFRKFLFVALGAAALSLACLPNADAQRRALPADNGTAQVRTVKTETPIPDGDTARYCQTFASRLGGSWTGMAMKHPSDGFGVCGVKFSANTSADEADQATYLAAQKQEQGLRQLRILAPRGTVCNQSNAFAQFKHKGQDEAALKRDLTSNLNRLGLSGFARKTLKDNERFVITGYTPQKRVLGVRTATPYEAEFQRARIVRDHLMELRRAEFGEEDPDLFEVRAAARPGGLFPDDPFAPENNAVMVRIACTDPVPADAERTLIVPPDLLSSASASAFTRQVPGDQAVSDEMSFDYCRRLTRTVSAVWTGKSSIDPVSGVRICEAGFRTEARAERADAAIAERVAQTAAAQRARQEAAQRAAQVAADKAARRAAELAACNPLELYIQIASNESAYNEQTIREMEAPVNAEALKTLEKLELKDFEHLVFTGYASAEDAGQTWTQDPYIVKSGRARAVSTFVRERRKARHDTHWASDYLPVAAKRGEWAYPDNPADPRNNGVKVTVSCPEKIVYEPSIIAYPPVTFQASTVYVPVDLARTYAFNTFYEQHDLFESLKKVDLNRHEKFVISGHATRPSLHKPPLELDGIVRDLSARRAEAVRDVLVYSFDIPEDKVVVARKDDTFPQRLYAQRPVAGDPYNAANDAVIITLVRENWRDIAYEPPAKPKSETVGQETPVVPFAFEPAPPQPQNYRR